MSLTKDDISQIRTIVREEVRAEVRTEVAAQLAPINEKLDNLIGRITAIENDIRDIYQMIAELQRLQGPTARFEKLTLEQKLLKLNTELLAAAKQAGITLPRS